MKRIISTLLLGFIFVASKAQTVAPTSQDIMKSNGKIYVVVAVVLTILLGLFTYVWNLDIKITKLENKSN